MADIERVSMSDVLDRAVDPALWLAPIDHNMRRGLQWCGGGMAAAIPMGLFGTHILLSWSYDGFFFFLGPLAVFMLSVLRSPVGIATNLVALVLFGLLYWRSDGLQEASIPWQRLGMALVGVGAVDIFAMTLPLAIVALNGVIWLVLGILAVILGSLCCWAWQLPVKSHGAQKGEQR